MQTLLQTLKSTPIIYVTRDLERALGLPLSTGGYFIVTNWSPFAKHTTPGRKNVLLIRGEKILDTRELLARPQTKKFIAALKNPRILVFKNTFLIEKICAKNNWRLLNPAAALASQVEEKISQLKWLGTLKKYLPPHKIVLGKNLTWNEKKDIVQFNRAHTGTGTILIESAEQIEELKKKFPNRPLRVTKFITGPAFTVNAVAWDGKVLVGNISYQITGLRPFTDQRFATVGNDWTLPRRVLSDKQSKQIKQIATDIGKKLAKDGWKGLFGVDVMMDERTGKIYLIEINARQPASATYESQLEKEQRTPHQSKLGPGQAKNKEQSSVFEAHLAALLGLPAMPTGRAATSYAYRQGGYQLCLPAGRLPAIKDGAQIIQRVPTHPFHVPRSAITKLKKLGLNIIEYNNTGPGQDLLRIQSAQGIMKRHNEFNDLGNSIIKK